MREEKFNDNEYENRSYLAVKVPPQQLYHDGTEEGVEPILTQGDNRDPTLDKNQA